MTHAHAAANRSRLHTYLLVAAPLGVLALGTVVAVILMATRPVVGKASPAASTVLVQVLAATRTDHAVAFDVMGTVTPAREVSLRARVAGHVQTLSEGFTPGGLLRKGDTLLTLDGDDYRLALRQAQSAVDTAQADLNIEMGQQRVARAQLDMLAQAAKILDGDVSLALRQPQLAKAQASLENARADLEQARLNLERTTVRAPFNALVTERSVNIASDVSTSDSLGTLVGTDEFWVEAAVPVDKLRWMRFASDGGEGSPAQITARSQAAPVAAQVLRRKGSLIESSRMAQVLVSVPDPLGRERGGAPLLLDEYVAVRITGDVMRDVVALPRSALREGASVWVFDAGMLRIRPVTVAWSDAETAFISKGVEPGERIVVSDIATPVDGMRLRLQDGKAANGGAAGGTAPEATEARHAG
ncbi:MAG: efflux RND transporter periplasmic adaptor subunit [Desulfovibrionaceae bacterium]